MPSVQLSFEQIVELVGQLSRAEQAQLVQALQGEPQIAAPVPSPRRQAAPEPLREPPPAFAAPAPPPPEPPRAVLPETGDSPPDGAGLMSRFSGLGKEAVASAAMQQPTAMEALQQASRLGDGALAHERLGGLKSFTTESRPASALSKPAAGGLLGRFSKSDAAVAAPPPAPIPAAEPPAAPPPAPGLSRFARPEPVELPAPEPLPPPPIVRAPEPPPPAVPMAGILGRFGAPAAAPPEPPPPPQAPAPPPPPVAPPAAGGGILGRFGGGTATAAAPGGSLLGRFGGASGAAATPSPLGGLGAGQLGKSSAESRLAPPAAGGGSLMNRFGSAPRQEPPAPTPEPIPVQAQAAPAAQASGGSLMNRFGTPPAEPPSAGLMGRFAEAAPPAAAPGGGLMGRFGGLQAEPPPAPAAAPPEPTPEPEPPPPPPAPAPAPAATTGRHWERALHELFAGVRKQAAYIAREELAEQISAAIEEVRQQ